MSDVTKSEWWQITKCKRLPYCRYQFIEFRMNGELIHIDEQLMPRYQSWWDEMEYRYGK